MLIAPFNPEFQLPIAPLPVIVFDLENRGTGKGIYVNLTSADGEPHLRLQTPNSQRRYHARRLAGALLQISNADPEINDGWVDMASIVPGNNKDEHVKRDRKNMKNHLDSVSQNFAGLIDFRNISRASQFRAVRPFCIAYTYRSKHHV